MHTKRASKDAPITQQIYQEIQTALRDIGATDEQVRRIPEMSDQELYALKNQLKADPYLQAYIGSWGNTLPDDVILTLLQQWNAEMRAA